MRFISTRDTIVRSKQTGHAIFFKKDVPTLVPDGMQEEVIERGISPVESDGRLADAGAVLDSKDVKVVLPPQDGLTRAKAIVVVMRSLIARNNPTDFTGGGQPNATAVTAGLGWKTDQKEVRQVWEKNREHLLRGDALNLG